MALSNSSKSCKGPRNDPRPDGGRTIRKQEKRLAARPGKRSPQGAPLDEGPPTQETPPPRFYPKSRHTRRAAHDSKRPPSPRTPASTPITPSNPNSQRAAHDSNRHPSPRTPGTAPRMLSYASSSTSPPTRKRGIHTSQKPTTHKRTSKSRFRCGIISRWPRVGNTRPIEPRRFPTAGWR